MSALSLPYMQPIGKGEPYQFLAMPKQLLTSKIFDGLHRLSKLLYGLMLDRLSLSAKHTDFMDKDGKTYIIYTIDQIQEDLRCARGTAVKLLGELVKWGLVEKKRRGQGKPNLLYIKDFRAVEEQPNPESVQESDADVVEPVEDNSQGVFNFLNSKNLTSENAKQAHGFSSASTFMCFLKWLTNQVKSSNTRSFLGFSHIATLCRQISTKHNRTRKRDQKPGVVNFLK